MAREKRLIDANALRQDIESKIYWGQLNSAACLEAIDAAPTEAVLQGHWLQKTDMIESFFSDREEVFYKCSVCREPNDRRSNYCPNCGAKMGEERSKQS